MMIRWKKGQGNGINTLMGKFTDIVEQVLTEGKHDKNIFKMVMVAGPPGAGKSYIASNHVNDGTLKLIDMDIATEHQLEKYGLGDAEDPKSALDFRSLTDQQRETLTAHRNKAAKMTYGKIENPRQKTTSTSDLYLSGKLGILLSITGSDYASTARYYKYFKNRGYDIMMVVVNAPLDICLFANSQRSRKVDEKIVRQKHKALQENLAKFQNLFKDDFTVYNNTERTGRMPGPELSAMRKKVDKFLRRPNTNPIYLQYMESGVV